MKYYIPVTCKSNPMLKVKRVVLIALCFALALLVGCRSQMHTDQIKYEAQTAELVAHYEAEMSAVIDKAEAGIYVSSRLPEEHAEEATLLAKMLYPYRNNSTADQIVACWCVFNRVESTQYPDTVEAVIRQPQQWMGYSEENPVLEELYAVAHNELSRWYSNDVRPMGNEYLFMSWSEDEIVLRDSFEETKRTHYWRA